MPRDTPSSPPGCPSQLSTDPAAGHESEPVRDASELARQFLEELVRGSFTPQPLKVGQRPGRALTLGQDWDNRFLALRDIDVDNRVVQSVQSRMARLRPERLARIDLLPLNANLATTHDLAEVTFTIVWNGTPDGTITLQEGDARIWGPAGGWRVWTLSP